jgi:hypothetical protein
LVRGQTRKGEEPVAGFLKTIGNGPVLKPPLADEGKTVSTDQSEISSIATKF